jgi:hypothetical protein
MTYGRVRNAAHTLDIDGAVVSHLAELVRGYLPSTVGEGPLIRPFGPPSPQGEKGRYRPLRSNSATGEGNRIKLLRRNTWRGRQT